MCRVDGDAPLSQIALLYEAVTGQTPDLSSTPAPALPPVASPQAAAGAGPAAGPGQPAAAPAAAPKPTLTSAASSPASSAGDNNPDDNISVTDLTGDESSALSQATAPAVPNPAIRQPVGKHRTADLLCSIFYAAACTAGNLSCVPAQDFQIVQQTRTCWCLWPHDKRCERIADIHNETWAALKQPRRCRVILVPAHLAMSGRGRGGAVLRCSDSMMRCRADVRSTAAAAGRVSVNGASAAPGGGKLAPGAIAGIAVVRPAAPCTLLCALLVRQRSTEGRLAL